MSEYAARITGTLGAIGTASSAVLANLAAYETGLVWAVIGTATACLTLIASVLASQRNAIKTLDYILTAEVERCDRLQEQLRLLHERLDRE